MSTRKASVALRVSRPKSMTRELATAPSKGRGKQPTQLIIPAGQPDTELLSVLVRDWVVPMLVRRFLAEYPPSDTVITQKPTTEALGMEDVG